MFAVESLTAGVKQGETSDDSNETRQGEYMNLIFAKSARPVLQGSRDWGFKISQ